MSILDLEPVYEKYNTLPHKEYFVLVYSYLVILPARFLVVNSRRQYLRYTYNAMRVILR